MDALIERGAKMCRSALWRKRPARLLMLYTSAAAFLKLGRTAGGKRTFRLSLRKEAENRPPDLCRMRRLHVSGRIPDRRREQFIRWPALCRLLSAWRSAPRDMAIWNWTWIGKILFSPSAPRSPATSFITAGSFLRGRKKTLYRFSCSTGTGIGDQRDGMVRKNILAGFTHLHALGTPSGLRR